MKTLLAIFGFQAAKHSVENDKAQLAVLSVLGLLAIVFIAAFLTNFIKARKTKKKVAKE